MVSVCTVPARGGRSCEHFGGYKTINRIPLPLWLDTAIMEWSTPRGSNNIIIPTVHYKCPASPAHIVFLLGATYQ